MKKCVMILLSFLLVLLSAGCGGKNYQKGQAFTYVLPETISSLDPQTATGASEKTVISMLYEGLCRIDSMGEAIPGAAKSWEANADNTQFTFHLRENVSWSEGTPLTAEDFVFGIRRALDPATKATNIENLFVLQNAREVNSGTMDAEQLGVSAPDARTVVFTLNSGYADFPKLTAGIRYMPCNQTFFEESGGHYGLEPIYTLTNGPFTFRTIYSWDPKKSIELARTNLYSGAQAVLPETLMLLMPGSPKVPANALTALYQGSNDLLQITEEQVADATKNGCQVITLHNSVLGLLLNTQNAYLKEPGLREIYMRTIDRKTVTSRLPEGTDEALGIFPPSVQWEGKMFQDLNQSAYPLPDADVVNNISGVLSGLDTEQLPSITIICPDDDLSKSIATGIIISWNKMLPNTFNMEPLDEATYLSRLDSGDYQAALYNINAGTLPISVLRQFASSAVPQLMENAAFDSALKDFTFTKDSFRQLEQTLMAQYVFYPIHYDRSFFALSPKAKDITVSADLGANFIRAVKAS